MSDTSIVPLDFTASTASIGGAWSFAGAACVTTVSCTTYYPTVCRVCDETLKRKDENLCPGCKDKVRAKLLFKYEATPGRPAIYSKINNKEDAIREWTMKQEKYNDTLTISNTDTWNGTVISSCTTTDTLQFYVNGNTIDTSTTATVRITDV